jgi:hypothetical protein
MLKWGLGFEVTVGGEGESMFPGMNFKHEQSGTEKHMEATPLNFSKRPFIYLYCTQKPLDTCS